MIDEERSPQRRRVAQFRSALDALAGALALLEVRPLTDLERAGAVQFFELSWDLAWKVMRDDVNALGVSLDYVAPNIVVRAGVAAGLVDDGDMWVEAGRTRNLLSHSYDSARVDAALQMVRSRFYPAFRALLDRPRATA